MKMDPHELLSLIKAIDLIRKKVETFEVATPCRACLWNDAGYCKRWKSIVPEEVRTNGCPDYEFDANSVPF